MLKKLQILLQNEIDPAYAKRAFFIFREIESLRPKTVLDVGCGRGFYLKALTLYPFIKKIYGVDINKLYIAKAKSLIGDKRVIIKIASIESLPFSENTFDCVISSEILEHIPDVDKGLKEINRVLKPGGTLLITVPNNNFPFFWDPLNWILMRLFKTHINKDIWWLAGMWADHQRLFAVKEIEQKKKKNGYKVLNSELFINYCWPLSHFLLYGIGKNLVERLKLTTGDRFIFDNKRQGGNLLAKAMAAPSRFLDRFGSSNNSSVGIGVKVIKK